MKTYSRPGYLQIPRDRIDRIIPWDVQHMRKLSFARALPTDVEVVTDTHIEVRTRKYSPLSSEHFSFARD